jgi:bifunctional non-homologous end joining protein LigD
VTRQRSVDGKGHSQRITVDDKSFNVTNLQKVLYPETGFTKAEVIDYYVRIGPTILPHLKDRPLTMKRYPDGVQGDFFFEKHCPTHRPEWIQTVGVAGEHKTVNYCMANDLASLVWVANLASLELHTSLSVAGRPESPTMMVFDLDPGAPATLLQAVEVAIQLRALFSDLGLESFPKTSGKKGLHVYVPLNTPVTYDDTKAFAHAIALLMEKRHRELVTSNMRKDLRAGKVFLDWSQNDDHKTTVCVYSLRAADRPTVSTPVEWGECEEALKRQDASRLKWDAKAVLKRIETKGDLFEPVLKLRQKLASL